MTFLRDDMSFQGTPELFEIHHQIYDTDFEEEIILVYNRKIDSFPFGNYTNDYIREFISLYEKKNMDVVKNIISFVQKGIIGEKSYIFGEIIREHPKYRDELEKYMVLI